jgi:hypothetical protein
LDTPLQKGNALEQVVEAIETLILHSSPNVKEKTYRIESKKHINATGVRHEIDLLVTFDLGPGYTSVYIFECKNWREAVGKNEIIVFSEKIDATQAQRGFFVAKSFTVDAKAQADKDPRMELIIAAEHDPANTILPFGLQYTFLKALHVHVLFTAWGSTGQTTVKWDPSQSPVMLNGTPMNMMDQLSLWSNETMNESMLTFASGTLSEGTYQREGKSERKFAEGELTVNDAPIEKIAITVQFEIFLVRPAVKSHFEVNGRGRVISLEGHTAAGITLNEARVTFGPEPINEARFVFGPTPAP